VRTISDRRGFFAFACALSDEGALEERRAALEVVKARGLAGQVASTKLAVDEVSRSTAQILAMLIDARDGQAQRDQRRMRQQLMPIDAAEELHEEMRKFMPGTRHAVVTQFDAWMRKGSETANGTLQMSSRVYWLTGGAGLGMYKRCS
jgi:hypothetical protein